MAKQYCWNTGYECRTDAFSMWEELPKYHVSHGFSYGFMLLAVKHIFAKEVVKRWCIISNKYTFRLGLSIHSPCDFCHSE